MYTNFRFGDYLLRSDTRQLLYKGTEVHLTPKAFELLNGLLTNHPNAVSKRELRDRLWPGTFVTDGNLALLITEIRSVLNDNSHNPRFIRTVHGFGYAFQANVSSESVQTRHHPPEGYSRSWLIWRSQALPLFAGPNTLGRQPGVDVLLEIPGISRLHAKITIEGDAAFIDDLGSKNGTYVENQPVASRTPLRDGDHVQLGPVLLLFRTGSQIESDETLTIRGGQPAS